MRKVRCTYVQPQHTMLFVMDFCWLCYLFLIDLGDFIGIFSIFA